MRKIETILLTALLGAMLLPVFFSATTPSVSADTFPSGSGTPEDPYIIENIDHLQAMKDNLTASYALGNDIDASATLTWNDNGDGGYYGFEPIGNDENTFTGIFDGREYKISNLYINRPFTNFIGRVGLFGEVGTGGAVKNVGLENEYVFGDYSVGGIVGINGGTIYNLFSTGTVIGYDAGGGLVGWNNGTVTYSYSTSSVSSDIDAGGIVGGNNTGTVSYCYSTGSINGGAATGGLIGHNYVGVVSYCYSTGAVNGSNNVGGLVGYNEENIFDSFWDNETSGQATSDGGEGKTTAEMMTITTFSDNNWEIVLIMGDYISADWYINNGNDYPRLWWEYPHPNKPTNLLPSTRQITTNVTLSCIATDNARDNINVFFWDNADNSLIDNIWIENGGTAEVVWSSLTRGNTYTFFAGGQDNTGLWGENSDTQSFLVNSLPTAPTLYTDLDNHETDHTPTIEWTVGTDADGDEVWTFVFMDNVYPPTTIENSTLENVENIGENSVVLVDGENYYYRLRSWDNYEWSAAYSDTDNFKMNSVPTAPSVSITPSSPYTNNNLVAGISTPSTDADSDSITYYYDWFKDDVKQTDNDNTIDSSATAKGENWLVVVTPWDTYENGENDNISVVILNTLPTCSITAPDNGHDDSVNTGIAFTSTASDIDGDTLTYAWDFGDTVGTSATQNTTYQYTGAGDYTVTLTVYDGGGSTTDSIVVNITAPSANDHGGVIPQPDNQPPEPDGGETPSGGTTPPFAVVFGIAVFFFLCALAIMGRDD